MGILQELFQTVQKLSALEQRTNDVNAALLRVERKLDDFLERLSRLEERSSGMRSTLKSEIMSDITADIVRVQARLDQTKLSGE